MSQAQAKKKSAAQAALARKAKKLKDESSKARLDRPASDTPPRPESDAPIATPISASPRQPRGPPRRLHLDKRAAALAAEDGDPDELMTTVECANWLGVSTQWLEGARSSPAGYGPPFVKISPNIVRYRRADVREWLLARTCHSTSEYAR
jgi:hypothetical protein